VEIHDLGDEEPPQLEGGENEKELEENDEGELEEETEQSVRRKRKQSNTVEFHWKTRCKKMNWPRFWPIWVNMSNLIAHLTLTPKKYRRSTLFMMKVHPKNCVTKRKGKRITLFMMRVYLERKVMRMKKRNNLFLVRIH